MKAFLCVYDIPTHGEARNPSAHFRRRGIRINLSCWCVPEQRIPWNVLNTLSEQGAKWHLVAFEQGENEKLMNIVVDVLKKDVEQAVKTAQACEQRARQPHGTETEQAMREKYWRRSLAAVSRARRLLRDAEECAKGFGCSALANDLISCRARIAHLHSVAENQAAAYARMTQALASLPDPVAQQMADDAYEDSLPAGIGTDYLLDAGQTPDAEQIAAHVAASFGQ